MKSTGARRTLASRLGCVSCSARYGLSEKVLLCSRCGGLLDVVYDLEESAKWRPARVRSLWRYGQLLPVTDEGSVVSLGEGLTPLIHAGRYGRSIGLDRLHLKLEFLNPTGSFKDRGTTVSVSKLKEMKVAEALDDSSGNAGSSLAAYCAAAGIRCTIYVPVGASSEKIVQAEVYGARTVRVRGARSNAAASARRAWKRTEAYYASHVLSPYFIDGAKTIAFEISEELGWKTPDHVVFPVGGGSLLLGAWRGFAELKELGLIERIPRLHCVQSEKCMPIVMAFRTGARRVSRAPEGETVAAGIRIAEPARGEQVLDALRGTGGSAESVSDTEILHQQRLVAKTAGIFAEPTSCAALAGLLRLRGKGVIVPGETVVVPITGSGLKDVGSVARRVV